MWAYWLCQLFGWGLNTFGQTVTGMSRDNAGPTLQIAFEATLLNALALLLTHLLRRYIKRHRWETLRIAALVPRVLATSFILGFPIAVIMGFMSIAMLWGGGPEDQAAIGELAGKPGLWLVRMDLVVRTLNWSAAFAFWIRASTSWRSPPAISRGLAPYRAGRGTR